MYTQVIPRLTITEIGANVKFECFSDSDKVWTFDNGKLPHNVFISQNTIQIRNAQLINSGVYKCISNDSDNNEHVGEGKLHVE